MEAGRPPLAPHYLVRRTATHLTTLAPSAELEAPDSLPHNYLVAPASVVSPLAAVLSGGVPPPGQVMELKPEVARALVGRHACVGAPLGAASVPMLDQAMQA